VKGPKVNWWEEERESFEQKNKMKLLNKTTAYALLSIKTELGSMYERCKE
jgi:hypothetical protein